MTVVLFPPPKGHEYIVFTVLLTTPRTFLLANIFRKPLGQI